ncbi:hypothetical protein N7467_004454 [Penicillium canescens]|nr:hypothetical protein N7467_004454 [Penicillium canescens]
MAPLPQLPSSCWRQLFSLLRDADFRLIANFQKSQVETEIATPSHTGCDTSEAFKSNLGKIISLFPDEQIVPDLLEQIEGTGEEKLREVGHRARLFKVLFTAWEALHLVSVREQMHVRDNVIQTLRSHPDLANKLSMEQVDIVHTYEAYRYFLNHLSMQLFPWTSPYFSDHMTLHAQFWNARRGIVFTAGDKQAPYLLTSIQSIRQLGCKLPIEIMYLGNEDLCEGYRNRLESIPGVITRDLSQMVDDEGWKLKGWAAKPFALLFSSFQHVILIDADSLFFRDPEVLFSDPLFNERGALFFKDRLLMPGSKKAWLERILPNPLSQTARKSRLWTRESDHMQESGVVVVDKWRHFVALLMVARMNGPDRDGNKAEGKVGIYDMVYGDKETFWLGWELVGDFDYAFHDGDAAVMGNVQVNQHHDEAEQDFEVKKEAKETASQNGEPDSLVTNFKICAPQILHLDTAGQPLWLNGWLLPNKFSNDDQQQPGKFDGFIKESKNASDLGTWKLGKNNVCCLTSDHISNFSNAEKEILETMIDIGRNVGAISGNESPNQYPKFGSP